MADKTMKMQVNLTTNVEQFTSGLTTAQNKLSAFEKIMSGGIGQSLSTLSRKLESTKDILEKPVSAGAFTSLSKDLQSTKTQTSSLLSQIEKFQRLTTEQKFKLVDSDEAKNIRKAEEAYNAYVKSVQKHSKENNADKQAVTLAQQKRDGALLSKNAQADRAAAAEAKKQALAAGYEKLDKAQAHYDSIKDDPSVSSNVKGAAKGQITKAQNQIAKVIEDPSVDPATLSNAEQRNKLETQYAKEARLANQELKQRQEAYAQADAAYNAAVQTKQQHDEEFAQNEWDTKVAPTAQAAGMTGATQDTFSEQLTQAKTQAAQGLTDALTETNTVIQSYNHAAEDAVQKTDEARASWEEEQSTLKNNQALLDRAKYFLSAAGAARTFARAVRSAFQSVKELDSVMTEMATVTTKSISDYWGQMSEYTERANELGVSITEAYKASTLYMQQGLKTNEVVGVANQTLKMARIAGLDAASATDKMTAALRGFNMEVNDSNAERVADVYSKLAAITAANVNEISSAMTKTASIASNAGMEFETTAAFLSQIIETTRESAETAGTALKTVIARFTELKKDPSEIQAVDGESVDANAIETALKSVGVSLRDASGQFRELDQVFLDLAQKWDGLDTNTQRYIATIAAGSRQQSRFVAMMSNYEHTLELVSAAENAAGASTEQYNKTLESLETKLNKLKNAWTTFTTGITNSDVIKGVVDVLAGLVNVLNQLTGWASKGVNSILKLLTAFAGFKLASNALRSFSVGMKTAKTGLDAMAGFKKVFQDAKDGIVSFGKKARDSFTNLTSSVKSFAKGFSTPLNTITDPIVKLEQENAALNEQIQRESLYLYSEADAYDNINQMSAQSAAIKAQLNQTTAQYNAYIAKGLTPKQANLLLTNADVKAEYEKILATEGDAAASKYLAMQTGSVSAAMIKNYATLLFSTNQNKRDAAAKMLNKASTDALTVSVFGLTIPLGILLIILIAVAAVIVGLVLAFTAANRNIKKLSEATANAKEAAEEASDAYDDLAEKLDNIKTAQEDLEDLAEGTTEWKDAVAELNDEVQELVTTYPELAKYVEVDAAGNLSIDTESKQVQAVLDQYEQQEKTADITYRLLNSQLTEATTTQDLRQSARKTGYGWDSKSGLGKAAAIAQAASFSLPATAVTQAKSLQIDNEVIPAIAQAFADQHMTVDMEGSDEIIKQALKDAGVVSTDAQVDRVADAIRENGEDFNELVNIASESNETIKAQYNMIRSDILSGIDFSNLPNYLQSIADTLYDIDQVAAMEEDYDTNKELGNYARSIGLDYDNNRRAIKALYAKANNYTFSGGKVLDSSGKEVDATFAEMKAGAQAYVVQQEATEALKKMPTMIQASMNQYAKRGNTDMAEAISRVLQDENGSELTQKNINDLRYSEDYVVDMWEANEETLTTLGYTLDTFREKFADILNTASNSFATATKDLTKIGVNLDTTYMTSGSAAGLANQLSQAYALNGNVNAVQAVADEINAIWASSDYSNDVKKSFSGLLAAQDWTDAFAIDDLKQALRESKLDVDIDNLAAALTNLDIAVAKIDLDSLEEDIPQFASLLNDLADGNVATASKEQVSLLKEYGLVNSTSFIQSAEDSDTYTYIGSVDELREAILGLSDVIQENIDQLSDEQNLYKNYGDFANGLTTIENAYTRSGTMTWNDLETASDSAAIALLNGLFENFTKDEKTTIAKATGQSDYSNLTGSDLDDYIAALKSALGTDNTATISNAEAQQSRSEQIQGPTALLKSALEFLERDSNATITNTEEVANLLASLQSKGFNNAALNKFADTVKDGVDKSTLVAAYEETMRRQANSNFEETTSAMSDSLSKAMTFDFESSEFKDNVNDALNYWGMSIEDEFAGNATLAYQFMTQLFNGSQGAYDTLTTLAEAVDGIIPPTNKYYDALIAAGLAIETEAGAILRSAADIEEYVESADLVDLWENAYSWIDNMSKELSAIQREREKTERAYERSLEASNFSLQESVDLRTKEIQAMAEEAKAQSARKQIAQNEINQLLEANPYFAKFVSATENGQYQVDYSAANDAGWMSEYGAAFEEFVDRLDTLVDEQNDAQDTLEEIQDDTEEIMEDARDSYIDLQNEVKDAMVNIAQNEIDKLSELNDTIQSAESNMITKMQEQIEAQRQERENQKTEESLSDKQARLAYLMADSAGGNQAEIAALQEEIADDQEAYQDTLVDQALQRMQDESDKAAEQRQQQIDIMQASLDEYSESKRIWADADDKIKQTLDELQGGIDVSDTTVGTLLSTSGDLGGAVSDLSKEMTMENLQKDLVSAKVFSDAFGYASDGTVQGNVGNVLTAITDLNNSKSAIGQAITTAAKAADGALKASQLTEYTQNSKFKVLVENTDNTGGSTTVADDFDAGSDTYTDADDFMDYSERYNGMDDVSFYKKVASDLDTGTATEKEFAQKIMDMSAEDFQNWAYTYLKKNQNINGYNSGVSYQRSNINSYRNTKAYATGGLADFTGPAWLDGSSSEPELVLNPTDTKNFIELKDILADWTNTESSSGDNYYAVNIGVDHLESDYDVEQLATKIKDLIAADASYRNVNNIQMIR